MQESSLLLLLFFPVAAIVLIIAVSAFVRGLKDTGGESTKEEQGFSERTGRQNGHPLDAG